MTAPFFYPRPTETWLMEGTTMTQTMGVRTRVGSRNAKQYVAARAKADAAELALNAAFVEQADPDTLERLRREQRAATLAALQAFDRLTGAQLTEARALLLARPA